jgi:curved DNA-binding protein CbpA
VLELPAGATRADVVRAYRRLCKRYHPDGYAGDPEKTPLANELLAEVNAAYAYLMQRLE